MFEYVGGDAATDRVLPGTKKFIQEQFQQQPDPLQQTTAATATPASATRKKMPAKRWVWALDFSRAAHQNAKYCCTLTTPVVVGMAWLLLWLVCVCMCACLQNGMTHLIPTNVCEFDTLFCCVSHCKCFFFAGVYKGFVPSSPELMWQHAD